MLHILLIWIGFASGRLFTEGATLYNCGGDESDKYAEIVRGKSDNTFSCGDVTGVTVNWEVQQSDNTRFVVAICPPPTNNLDSCSKGVGQYPVFFANRTTSGSSVVTVNPTLSGNSALFESGTLTCTGDTCSMDYIVPVSGTCNSEVTMTSLPWTVTTNCKFTQGNSTRNRYACQLVHRNDMGNSDTVVVAWKPMSPNNLPSGTAQCDSQSALPSGNGNYSYRVQVRPGRNFITVGTLVFRRPTAPAWTCSPPGIVTENSTVICTCTTTDIGVPAGTLLWVTGSSNNFDVNNPLVTSTGGANSVVLTKKLTRTDHGSQYRCDTKWSSNNTPGQQVYNAQVGYPPTTANLTVNFQITRNLTVNDNSTVTFKCEAIGGNPMSSISVSGPRATFSPSGPSPLTSQLTDTQCKDTGTFTCTAGNGYGKNVTIDTTLFVNCKPRSDDTNLSIEFYNQPVMKTFEVTAYPVPTNFTFFRPAMDGFTTTTPPTTGLQTNVACQQKNSSVDYVFTCTLTVLNVTSQAAGQYTLRVGNGQGYQDYSLNISHSTFKPYRPSMMIGSSNQSSVTVRENATVTITCQANAIPVATMTLDLLGDGRVNRGQSPMLYTIESARCEDTGQYVCSASNSQGEADRNVTQSLFVTCSPRSSTSELGSLNFQSKPVLISFEVTSYPAPSGFKFKFRGVNGSTASSETITDAVLCAKCDDRSTPNQFTCYIAVLNVTSPNAAGFYTVTVTNGEAQQEYTFQLLLNGESSDTNSFPAYLAVTIALAILVLLLLITIVIAGICLWRNGRIFFCPVPQKPRDLAENADHYIPSDPQPHDPASYAGLRLSEINKENPYAVIEQQNNTESPDTVYEIPKP